MGPFVRLGWVLIGLLVSTPAHAAKTLAEAAASLAEKMPAGCIVTAEQTKTGTRFALAGQSPDLKQAPEDLVFEIASLTKLFTGLLLAQATIEKKVTLETTVRELLGKDFAFADPRVGRITLQQLSTHTSGLPRMPAHFDGGFQGYATWDDAKLYAWLAKVELPQDGPYACSYSNVGVGLLGQLLARLYHQSWSDCIVEKICRPLGLNHTLPSHLPAPGVLAPPYAGAQPSIVTTFKSFAPAGSLRSSATDLLKFGQALLHPEQTSLTAAIKLATQPHAASNATGGKIGLGPFIQGPPGGIQYFHNGATAGYRSAIQVTPATETVRVVLINNTTFEGGAVLQAMR